MALLLLAIDSKAAGEVSLATKCHWRASSGDNLSKSTLFPLVRELTGLPAPGSDHPEAEASFCFSADLVGFHAASARMFGDDIGNNQIMEGNEFFECIILCVRPIWGSHPARNPK